MTSSSSIKYVRDYNRIEKLVFSKLFWLIFVSLAFGYPLVRSMLRELPPAPAPLYKVPEFELINEFGKTFGSKNLEGKAYLASFVFTSCPTTCPGQMERLQKVQKRMRGLGTNVAIVTFTVDPEYDTPKVLHKFARKYQSNPFIWSFLTTKDWDQMNKLVVKGFKVPMGSGKEKWTGQVNGEEVTMMDIVHSERLVLVDQKGFVRNYYSNNKDALNKLMIDVGLLANRPAK
ncbi:MAG: SCO family protein [Halobacteriovoraceae bacterium]|nr:SCO family protein [Halobacteriovoraceae bacterium]